MPQIFDKPHVLLQTHQFFYISQIHYFVISIQMHVNFIQMCSSLQKRSSILYN